MVQVEALTNFDTPAAQEKKLIQLFRWADLDSSGDVSRSEFSAVLSRLHFGKEDANLLFDWYDANLSGSISYAEFAGICRQRAAPAKRRFKGTEAYSSW